MATSNSYSYNPSLGEVILYVYQLVGIRPSATLQEHVDAVANGLLQGILANTINQEKANAAKHAQDDVPPIPIEPGA